MAWRCWKWALLSGGHTIAPQPRPIPPGSGVGGAPHFVTIACSAGVIASWGVDPWGTTAHPISVATAARATSRFIGSSAGRALPFCWFSVRGQPLEHSVAGLVRATRAFSYRQHFQGVDARDKPGHG